MTSFQCRKMAEIVHYTNPQSRGMRTQLLLETFDIPHRSVVKDFKSGELQEKEYLAIHPYGRVPALVDGDLTVIESGAITLYLADKFPDKLGTPAIGTPERARLYEWLFFLQATLEPVAIESFTTDDKSQCIAKIKDLLTAMESRFKGPYALGEEFTLLDVIIACEVSWYKMMEIFPQGLDTFDRHLERVAPKISKSYGGYLEKLIAK